MTGPMSAVYTRLENVAVSRRTRAQSSKRSTVQLSTFSLPGMVPPLVEPLRIPALRRNSASGPQGSRMSPPAVASNASLVVPDSMWHPFPAEP
jgi:hypothetical protein